MLNQGLSRQQAEFADGAVVEGGSLYGQRLSTRRHVVSRGSERAHELCQTQSLTIPFHLPLLNIIFLCLKVLIQLFSTSIPHCISLFSPPFSYDGLFSLLTVFSHWTATEN